MTNNLFIRSVRAVKSRFTRWRNKPDFEIDRLAAGEVDQTVVLRAMVRDMLVDRRADRRAKLGKAVLYFLMFALPAVLYVSFYAWSAGLLRWGPSSDVVGVVSLTGEMADGTLASADRVIPALRKAFENPRVKAVVLSIDSPGGAPLEAERIYSAIDSWRKTNPKPVIAVINNLGASAAYMVALHCDEIYAGRYSLVGSVGAVLSGWDLHRALERVEVGQRVYTSGNLKAMMNPYLPMTPEADRKARDLVTQMGTQFREELIHQRGKKLQAGQDFTSGEIWGGVEANRLGLTDGISTLDQVVKTRWSGMPIHQVGPNNGALPFVGASSEWLRGLLASAIKPSMELR